MDVLKRQLRGVAIVLDELRQIRHYSAEAERRLRELRRGHPPAAAFNGELNEDLQEETDHA